jgi:hypothetical protein
MPETFEVIGSIHHRASAFTASEVGILLLLHRLEHFGAAQDLSLVLPQIALLMPIGINFHNCKPLYQGLFGPWYHHSWSKMLYLALKVLMGRRKDGVSLGFDA